MTKNATRSVALLVFLCAGAASLLLRGSDHLADGVASIVLVVLMISAIASYFVIGHLHKGTETTNSD